MRGQAITRLGWLGLLLAGPCLPAQPERPAEIMPLADRSLLLDVTLAGDRAVAVGERGHILVSDDDGRTWRQVPSPTRATLTAVSFADARHGWAVGHDNTVLATADGGESWRLQYPPGPRDISLLAVHFTDARRGIAAGAYAAFFTTADGGLTWVRRNVLEEELHVNRITRGPDGRLFMALEGGALLVSGDDGESWEPLDSPYAGSLFGVLPLTARTWLAYGLRGHVFRSADEGATWDSIATPSPVLITHALRLSGGAIVLAGQGEQFMVSHDGGRRFELWRVPVQAAAALTEAADGALLAVGGNGVHRLQPPQRSPASRNP